MERRANSPVVEPAAVRGAGCGGGAGGGGLGAGEGGDPGEDAVEALPRETGGRGGDGHGGDEGVVVGPRGGRIGAARLEREVFQFLLERRLSGIGGKIFSFFRIGGDAVDLEIVGGGFDVVADANVIAEAESLHLAALAVAMGGLEAFELGRAAGLLVFEIERGASGRRALTGERGEKGDAIGARGNGESGGGGKGGQPIPVRTRSGDNAAGGDAGGPTGEGGDASAAFPEVAFDAIEGTVAGEKLGRDFLGEVAFEGGTVIGRENDERVFVDGEIAEQLDEIADGVVDAADAGRVAAVDIGPRLIGCGGIAVGVVGGGRVVGVRPRIEGGRRGVDHAAGLAEPLESALEAAAGGVGLRGELENRVWRIVGEVEEKGLGGRGFLLVSDPFFSARGEEVGSVAAVELGGDFGAVVPDFNARETGAGVVGFFGGGSTFLGAAAGALDFFIRGFLRVVLVAVAVADVAEVGIEAAVERMGGPIRRLAVGATLKAPFADCGGGVAGAVKDGGERVIFGEGFVELVVADVGVALVDTGEQRGAGGRADGGGAVVVCELGALGGEAIELRSELRGAVAGGAAGVLEKDAEVTVAEVVGEDEDDVGRGGCGRGRSARERGGPECGCDEREQGGAKERRELHGRAGGEALSPDRGRRWPAPWRWGRRRGCAWWARGRRCVSTMRAFRRGARRGGRGW